MFVLLLVVVVRDLVNDADCGDFVVRLRSGYISSLYGPVQVKRLDNVGIYRQVLHGEGVVSMTVVMLLRLLLLVLSRRVGDYMDPALATQACVWLGLAVRYQLNRGAIEVRLWEAPTDGRLNVLLHRLLGVVTATVIDGEGVLLVASTIATV